MLNNETQLDLAFRALADPTRRAIVDQLSRGPASVSQLAGPLKMSLAAVVQHIQLLEESGVVRTRKVGRVRTCSIEPLAISRVEQWLTRRRLLWQRRLDLLGAVLDEDQD